MYGAKATMNVWNPTVEAEGEFSLSQIWITSGSYDRNDLNSIEVGWHVSPDLYQDNKSRLFIYWTSDTYNVTGCYNLQCRGFIQTSNTIILGGTITPVSTFEGKQFEITVSVWKDQESENWWLSLGSNHSLVGYWPSTIFPNLAYADDVQWGGEVVNSQSLGRHTTTQMGSGRFSDGGFRKVSYFRNLEIVDNNRFKSVRDVGVLVDDPKFYNIRAMFRDDWGSYILYGGPDRMHSGVSFLALSSFIFYFSFIIFIII
ncbi:putative neprosin [Arabidopsis thaliana]